MPEDVTLAANRPGDDQLVVQPDALITIPSWPAPGHGTVAAAFARSLGLEMTLLRPRDTESKGTVERMNRFLRHASAFMRSPSVFNGQLADWLPRLIESYSICDGVPRDDAASSSPAGGCWPRSMPKISSSASRSRTCTASTGSARCAR